MSRTRARSSKSGASALQTNTEEATLWTSTLSDLHNIHNIGEQLDALRKQAEQEGDEEDNNTLQQLLAVFRKRREAAEKQLLTIESTIEQLNILIALRDATEDSAPGSQTASEVSSDTLKRRRQDAESTESGATQSRSKKAKNQLQIGADIQALFHVNAQVAFHMPKSSGQESDWIQCTIVKVIREGTKTKYEVKDPEPSDSQGHSETYRTTAANLVPLSKSRDNLPVIPSETKVLARYPETTTFYPATLKSMRRHGTCKLVFDGDGGRETEVDRLLVFEPPT